MGDQQKKQKPLPEKSRGRSPKGMFLRCITGIVRFVAIAVTIAALLLLGIMVLPRIFGFYPYVILSSSMEPTIPAGAVAFADTKEDLVKPGDIIAFSHPEDPEIVVVHRVIGVSETGYRTKGDANEAPDGEEIPKEGLIGVNRFHIPWIGYVVQWLTRTGVEWWIVLILGLNIAAELLHKLTKQKRRKKIK